MTPPQPSRTWRRALARVLVLGATLVAGVALTAGAASAHPTLLYTTPAAETADPTPPQTIILVFGEPVTVAAGGVAVTDADGKAMPVEAPGTAKNGHAVTARLPQTLPAGVYTVTWRVTGADGDLVEGRFRFAVGAALDPAAAVGGAVGGPSWPTTMLRFVLLAGLTLAAGGMVGDCLVRRARTINPSLPAVEGWTSLGALGGAAVAVALSARLATQSALDSTATRVAMVQAVAFIVIVVAQAVRRTGVTVVALTAVAVAEAIRAHPNVTMPGWGAALTAVHVTAAVIWAGTLIHVLRAAVVWRAHPGAIRWLIASYARLALWLVAAVVLTGSVSALLLVPLSTALSTTYGRLLLLKIGLVAAAVGTAFLARRALAANPASLRAVTRPARIEAGLLGVVLAVTATLTVTPPPADSAAGQLPPPPPAGVVVPLGTLAGQIGVGVQASDGRVVVRLAAPSREDYYSTTRTTQTYELTGRLIPADRAGSPDLAFRGCGQGCYLAEVDWADGDNLLTLHAAAEGWHGGTVSLLVPWPVGDGTARLAQAVAAMRALPEVAFTETVTSDTSQPTPDPTPLTLDAADFLTLQPYGTGQAPQAVQLPAAAGQTRLALGYPAEARYIQLTLDDQLRIIDEVQVDPKHLTRRHYLHQPAA